MSAAANAQAAQTLPALTITSTPSPEFLEQFVSILAAGFSTNPFTTCFSSQYGASVSDRERRIKHFREMTARSLGTSSTSTGSRTSPNAAVAEAGSFAAVALWDLPVYARSENSSSSSASMNPVLAEFKQAVSALQDEFIGTVSLGEEYGWSSEVQTTTKSTAISQKKPFYHLALLARAPGREKVRGAVRALIDPFLEKARIESVPAWLEATSEVAVSMYEHFGFRTCAKVVVGIGKYAPDGTAREAGEGITAWCMLYDPHLR